MGKLWVYYRILWSQMRSTGATLVALVKLIGIYCHTKCNISEGQLQMQDRILAGNDTLDKITLKTPLTIYFCLVISMFGVLSVIQAIEWNFCSML